MEGDTQKTTPLVSFSRRMVFRVWPVSAGMASLRYGLGVSKGGAQHPTIASFVKVIRRIMHCELNCLRPENSLLRKEPDMPGYVKRPIMVLEFPSLLPGQASN